MSASGTAVASRLTALDHPEVIDVDAFDDTEEPDIQLSGYQQRRFPSSLSQRQNLAADGLVYMGFRHGASGRSHRTTSAHAGSSNATPSGSGSRGVSEEAVIVVESEEEDVGSSSSASSSTRRFSRTSRRMRLVSPPPPPPERGHTPAVPEIPRHLASQTSLPIRPIAQPLPFENRMSTLPRLPPRGAAPPPAPAPAPAPRSHHRPTMGFGGALIALNRQHALEGANHREREREAAPHIPLNLPSFTEIYRRLTDRRAFGSADPPNTGPGESRWTRLLSWPVRASARPDTIPGEDDELSDDPFDFDPYRYGGLADLARSQAKQSAAKKVHWRPEYTHPHKPGPGFSFNFAPIDDSSSESSSNVIVLDDDEARSSAVASSSNTTDLETTLVCARCLDPLILGAPEGASSEEQKRRRVWALRCGHMVDGKCISQIMQPLPPPPPPEELRIENKDKGKGKARANDEEEEIVLTDVDRHAQGSRAAPTDVPPPIPDRKGKRKAVAILEPEDPKRTALDDPVDEGSAYRSRLRSHVRVLADAVADGELSPPRAAASSRRRGRPSLAVGTSTGQRQVSSVRGHGKGKGKGMARVGGGNLAVEAEHEWKCPVASCGRVHYSVLVGGEWKNDEGRGGIALFL